MRSKCRAHANQSIKMGNRAHNFNQPRATLRARLIRNYSLDYSLNCTQLSPITITYYGAVKLPVSKQLKSSNTRRKSVACAL